MTGSETLKFLCFLKMKIKLGSKKRLNIYFTILDAFLNKINEKLYIKIV